jgi:hypothetical protein
VDSYQAGLNDQFLPSLRMEQEVSAQSLQVLVKQADLDKGRRNDGLASKELRQARRKVRCPLPCVANAVVGGGAQQLLEPLGELVNLRTRHGRPG